MSDNNRFSFAPLEPKPKAGPGQVQSSGEGKSLWEQEIDRFDTLNPNSPDFHGFEYNTLAYVEYQRQINDPDPLTRRRVQKKKRKRTEDAAPIQAKLEVAPADDPLEMEADAVADRVMRMPEPASPAGEAKQPQQPVVTQAELHRKNPRMKGRLLPEEFLDESGAQKPNLFLQRMRESQANAKLVQRELSQPAFTGSFGEYSANTRLLSPAQIATAIQKTTIKGLEVDAWIRKLGRIAGDEYETRVVAALIYSRSPKAAGGGAVGEDFVVLVAAAQQILELSVTGILDQTTQKAANAILGFADEQEIKSVAGSIIASLQSTENKFDREAIVISLRNADQSGILSQVMNEVKKRAGEVGQTADSIVSYMYASTGEFREALAEIVLKSKAAKDVAGIRAAQIRESNNSSEIYGILAQASDAQFAFILQFLEGFTADSLDVQGRSDSELFVEWLFYDKVEDPVQREKLRRLFVTRNSSAKLYAASYAAIEVARLLETERRVESDIGILMFFSTTPPAERARLLGRIDTSTRSKFRESGEEALQSRMLPMNFDQLKSMSGVRLTMQSRKLNAEEQAAVAADYAQIVQEIALGIPKGVFNGLLGAAADLVKLLVVGGWESVQGAIDLVFSYVYLTSDGFVGAESFERVGSTLMALEQFADDPSGMAVAAMEAAWEDTLIGSDVLVGPGSSGESVAFWVSASTKFITNLTVIIGGAAAGTRVVVRRLNALKETRKVQRRKKMLEERMALKKEQEALPEAEFRTDQLKGEELLGDFKSMTRWGRELSAEQKAHLIEKSQTPLMVKKLPSDKKMWELSQVTGREWVKYEYKGAAWIRSGSETGVRFPIGKEIKNVTHTQPTSAFPSKDDYFALLDLIRAGSPENSVRIIYEGKAYNYPLAQLRDMDTKGLLKWAKDE